MAADFSIDQARAFATEVLGEVDEAGSGRAEESVGRLMAAVSAMLIATDDTPIRIDPGEAKLRKLAERLFVAAVVATIILGVLLLAHAPS